MHLLVLGQQSRPPVLLFFVEHELDAALSNDVLRLVAFHFGVEVQGELVVLLIGAAIAFEVQLLVIVSIRWRAGREAMRLESSVWSARWSVRISHHQ